MDNSQDNSFQQHNYALDTLEDIDYYSSEYEEVPEEEEEALLRIQQVTSSIDDTSLPSALIDTPQQREYREKVLRKGILYVQGQTNLSPLEKTQKIQVTFK